MRWRITIKFRHLQDSQTNKKEGFNPSFYFLLITIFYKYNTIITHNKKFLKKKTISKI